MDTQSKIQNYIVGACRESGFYLMPNSKSKRKPVGNRLATTCFNCSHHKCHHSLLFNISQWILPSGAGVKEDEERVDLRTVVHFCFGAAKTVA